MEFSGKMVGSQPARAHLPADVEDCTSLVDLLRYRAASAGERLAIGFIDAEETLAATMDFAGLDRRARAIGTWLSARGPRGQRVMLALPTGTAYLEAFFGCLYAGAIPVPVFPPHSKSFKAARLDNVLRDCAATHVLATSPDVALVHAWLSAAHSAAVGVALDDIADALADDWVDPKVGAADVAFLQYTSGSTQAPKGVMVSHANLFHNLRLMRQRWHLDEHSNIVSWLPIFHDLGMVGNNLLGVYLGAPQFLMVAQEFVKRPGAWMRAISRHRGRIAMAPNFAYRLCSERVTPAEKAELDLSCWDVAVNGGEPVIPEMMDQFLAEFAPCGFRPQALTPVMGMAETTLFISATAFERLAVSTHFDAQALRRLQARECTPDLPSQRVMSCGPALDEFDIRIVDPKTRELLAAGGIGELWVRGPSVALGYWNKAEATEASFCAYTADSNEGPFLRTGDQAFLHEGELYICGRLKNMIIIRGQNYAPSDIEIAVEACHPALRRDFGVAFAVESAGEERLVIVYEVDQVAASVDITAVRRAAAAAVADNYDLQLQALVLVARGTLSKTTSGKVTREKTRDEFIQGQLTVVAEWLHPALRTAREAHRLSTLQTLSPSIAQSGPASLESLKQWITEELAALLGIEPGDVDPEVPFAAHGLDSIGAVELAARLERRLACTLASQIAYDYPSVVALSAHLAAEPAAKASDAALKGDVPPGEQDAVAVIGMACRLPGAANIVEFWNNLIGGVDAISELPPERWEVAALAADPQAPQFGGFIGNVAGFDPEFFGIAATEAAAMDPQQRLLLEVVWESLESAGLSADRVSGSQTGVFVGISNNDYARLEYADDAGSSPYDGTGNAYSIAANRLSYLWDLRGPSLAVDTACSSSLVAVHLATRSLLAGECTMAIVAGVNLLLAPDLTRVFAQAGMMSPAGRCRSFDDAADGYVRSEGCVALLLKPLSAAVRDGDRIHALIRGSAVNQDGRSNGLTAPNGPAQEQVLRAALEDARLTSDQIDCVEAHGSGTPLGDPIEAGALQHVYGQRERPLLIGSVKTNIGHLEAAAGIAGLLKMVLALEHEQLPASLHFRAPNRRIAWQGSALKVCAQAYHWPRGSAVRRAGVTSFGFGGTNAHVVVEEAPAAARLNSTLPRGSELLLISAKSEVALRELAQRYCDSLAQIAPDALASVCTAAARGRTPMRFRMAVVGDTPDQLRGRLDLLRGGKAAVLSATGAATGTPRVAILCAGQGGTHAGMARELYDAIPLFRRRLDQCLAWSAAAGCPEIAELLLSADGSGAGTAAVVQPAQFAYQWALLSVWLALGVVPEVLAGHSIGEYAAACAAGLLKPEDALRLLAARGRLMDTHAQPGGMLALAATPEQLSDLLRSAGAVSIAARNGPQQTVCAGAFADLAEFAEHARTAGLHCTKLDVTHAFHSPLMQPVLVPFRAFADGINYQTAAHTFVSCVDGRRVHPGERLGADYWTTHIQAPVAFTDGMRMALAEPVTHVLEVGPRLTLAQLAATATERADLHWLQQLADGRSQWTALLAAAARLTVAGANLDWSVLYPDPPHGAQELPHYPFQRRRCWNRKPRTTQAMSDFQSTSPTSPAIAPAVAAPAASADHRSAVYRRIAELIGTSLSVTPEALDPRSSFLDMGMDSISLIGVVRALERDFGLRVEIRQMFEALQNIEKLADYVAARVDVPALAVAVAPTAPSCKLEMPVIAPIIAQPAAAIVPALVQPAVMPSVADGWQGLLSQQLQTMAQLMQNQLALLGAGAQLAPAVSTPLIVPTVAASAPMRPRAVNAAPSIPMWKVAETTATPLTPVQRQHLDALIARYCARTAGSKAYATQHRAHLADNRVVAGFRALTKEMHYPLVSRSASGARMRDIDDNEYIDVTMGFGVNLFGHNPRFVTDAIAERLQRGIQLGPQADLAGEVAQLISELTGNERSAFVNSGTEAVMIACRLARAATGRDTVVIFNGAYHGQHDSTIAITDPEDPQFQAIPGVPGITQQAVANTVMLNYGEESALDYIRRNADNLAAVLVEPVQSRRPELQPREFLQALRAITEQHGIALILDEMLTGFRCHPGGAQALFDIRADLVTYGKIIGGGLPIGVVSGRRRFMDVVDGGDWRYGDDSYPSVGTTFVSGTHSKHPLTMAAAHAVLLHMKQQGPRLQQRLTERTARFAGQLNQYFAEQSLPISVPHFASLFRIAFAGNANLMYYHLLEKGVFLWEGRVYALSTAHTDADLAHIIEAVKSSVDELREGGFLPAAAAGAPRRVVVAPQARAVAATPAVVAVARTETPAPRSQQADFSLSFFGRYERDYTPDKYDLLFAGARFGDTHGFRALWVPERHFHPFGGFSPNPSVTAAALARETTRIQLRAGSVVIPLHHPVRVAEEWSLVDNLSQGRVGIAAASGWHPEDFALAPESYRDNRDITFRNLETIQRLWRGEAVECVGGTGRPFGARIYPLPRQAELPIWVTVVKNPDTYAEAGRRGFGILTNMMGQTPEELRANIGVYKQARAQAGFAPDAGAVAVLVHTYISDDAESAQEQAALPFRNYLSTMSGLLDSLARHYGKEESFNALTPADRDYLLDTTYRRYLQQSALIGSVDSCTPIVASLIEAGVTEFACFVDFGIDPDQVRAGLPHLNQLRARFVAGGSAAPVRAAKQEVPESALVTEEDL